MNEKTLETIPNRETIDRGKRIREARQDWCRQNPDRTSKELIARIGISEPAYYAWESGNVGKIKAEYLLQFVLETRWNPLYLMYEQEPKKLLDDPRLEALIETLSELDDKNLELVLEYALDRKARQNPPAD